MHILKAIAVVTLIGLTSCATQPTEEGMKPFDVREELAKDLNNAESESPVDTALVESPDALTTELLSLTAPSKVSTRIDIEATARPAAHFFADLGRSQEINILVDPNINQPITLSLRNVTLNQVLAALRDIYGFDFEQTSYGFKVAPNQLSTRIYKLNYLNVNRQGTTETSVSGESQNTLTTAFSSNNSTNSGLASFWSGIEASIESLILPQDSRENSVVINPQTGLMVVTATTIEHSDIAEFLATAELILQKQVIIEAKIVEVTLSEEFQSGIDWNFLNNNINSSGAGFGVAESGSGLAPFEGVGGVFNISLGLDNFSSLLQLLDHQGDVQVLSSPRVSTVNNQKAVIKVGTDEFFATNITGTGSTDDEDASSALPFTLEQFFSGIALDVTPQISDDNNVTLHVRPTVTEVVERTKVINVGSDSYSLPLAYSNIRESDSIIRAESGQIIVIGGLLQHKQNLGSTGLPGISKWPIFNFFFRQERQSQEKSELIILLKPTVYDQSTSSDDIQQLLNRID